MRGDIAARACLVVAACPARLIVPANPGARR